MVVERGVERGDPRRTDPSEEDRARTRARGTGVEAAQEVNVQGGNLFGVHGPLSTSKLAGSHPAQSASKARAKDRALPEGAAILSRCARQARSSLVQGRLRDATRSRMQPAFSETETEGDDARF